MCSWQGSYLVPRMGWGGGGGGVIQPGLRCGMGDHLKKCLECPLNYPTVRGIRTPLLANYCPCFAQTYLPQKAAPQSETLAAVENK